MPVSFRTFGTPVVCLQKRILLCLLLAIISLSYTIKLKLIVNNAFILKIVNITRFSTCCDHTRPSSGSPPGSQHDSFGNIACKRVLKITETERSWPGNLSPQFVSVLPSNYSSIRQSARSLILNL